MPTASPAHDFLLPRLTKLLNEAVSAGIARDVAVAVFIDLVTSPNFDRAEPDPKADSDPHPIWDRGPESLVVINGASPAGPPALDARDEADFVKPIGLFDLP